MFRIFSLVIRALALLACMAWLGNAAQSQEQPAPLQLRISPRLAEAISPEQRDAAPLFLQGRTLKRQQDNELVLDGDVELRRSDLVIRADQLTYDQAHDLARARGHVRINQAGNIFEGPALQLRLNAFEGFVDQAQFELLSNDAHGSAERVEFIDPKRSKAYNVSYTTCPRPSLPDWVLRAATLNFDTEEETAEGEDVSLEFKQRTLMRFSSLTFPMSDKRKSGFLPPAFGVDNVSGTEVTIPYYWNLAPNRDLTVYPTYMTARGASLGGEFRYLESNYLGRLRLDYMPQDKLRNLDRWGWSFQQSGGYQVDGLGRLALNLNLNRVSDDNYWRDFPRSNASLTQRLLANDATLSWGQGPYSASLRTLKWQTLQDPLAPIVPPYDRMPQIVGRYTQPFAQGFDLALETDYTQFEANPVLTGQPNAQRSLLRTQLSYPLLGPAGFFTPKVLLHTTNYDFDTPLTTGQQQSGRTVPTLSLDGGLILERDTTYQGQPFRQTLEPRLFYVYTPYTKQDYLPNYDTGLLDFSFASIYSENAFIGNDRIGDNNLLTAGVSSRLLDAQTGSEFIRLGIAQRFRLEDQRVTLPGGTPEPKGISDVLLGAGLTLEPRWYFDSTTQYNPTTEKSVRITQSLRYNPTPYRVFNLAYRFQRDSSEQIDVGWQWPLNDLWGDRGQQLGPGRGQGAGRWYSVARLNYSMLDRQLVDSVMGFEYDAGCWLGRIVLERLQTGVVTATQRIMFQLEFVGFSRVGIDPLQTLRTNIPRYQFLRDQTTPASRFSNYD